MDNFNQNNVKANLHDTNFSRIGIITLSTDFTIEQDFRKISSEQRKIFDDNKWEIHEAAPSIHNSPPPMCYSSIWLSMNVLIIDPKTICVEATEEKMIKQMESFGLDVIPVPFRDVYAFGGSLHCATTDVHREGECEDYFPNQ